jgi:hypothetical protein
MRNLELIEQSYDDYMEIEDLAVDEWYAAVHQQVELGPDFNQELAQGEKALEVGKVNEAFMHLHAAESKLAPGGDWERRERWLYAAARLYHAADRTDEMLGVYRIVMQMAWDTLGEDHPLPRRLQSSLNELAWAHATGQAERLQALVDSIEEASLQEPADHQRNIQSLAAHYGNWTRCMDVAKWCLGNGEAYWAEVALRAAQHLGGEPDDHRQLETLYLLVTLYEQYGKPWLAEREIKLVLDHCLFSNGFHSLSAKRVRKMLKELWSRHGQKTKAKQLGD